jgi:hypothetical protein
MAQEDLHLVECNFPHGPLGQPGCVCTVVNKKELAELHRRADAFDEIKVAIESFQQYLQEHHYKRWDCADKVMSLLDVASFATTGKYVD